MSEAKTPWKKLQNKDYLGECDFMPGEEKTVTIESITTSEITGDGGKVSEKPVMKFAEKIKPLIVNTTNFKTLQKLFSSKYIEDWIGKRIILYGDPTVTFGKQLVGGVRIKKELPKGIRAAACSECGQIIKATDEFTAAQIIKAGINRYGKPMCMDCVANDKQDKKENTPDENNADQDQEPTGN